MIGKANHYGSRFAAQKQGRHFARRRKPAETKRMLYGIMIAEGNHYGSPLGLAPKCLRLFCPAGHFASQKSRETQRIF